MGSAVSAISAQGDLLLPDQFCVTIQSRGSRDDLFVGIHSDDPCMLVFDHASVADYHGHLLQDEGGGTCDTVLRRRLGFVAPARMDGKGRLRIASWMRSRRGVQQRALLVGMGRHFEIWNVDQVLEHGPGDLIVLASLHLNTSIIKEDHHEPALSRFGAHRRATGPGKPRVPVQPLPALPARPDPIRAIGVEYGRR